MAHAPRTRPSPHDPAATLALTGPTIPSPAGPLHSPMVGGSEMVVAGVRLTLVSVALLGLATAALAQITETRGTVQRVDAQTGTVYFTDGRTLRLEPSTRLYVDGREVRLADVQPGWTLMTSGPTVAPGTVVVQQPIAPVTLLPGVDATGIVGQVDARTGTITLQDGRIVRVTPGTTVWQPVTIGSGLSGAARFVPQAA